MQLSNGVSNPAGMWLGHLLFDGIVGVIIATVVVAVFATTQSDQFRFIPLLVWNFHEILLSLELHGVSVVCDGALWIHIESLRLLHLPIFSSGNTVFLICAAYQFIMFIDCRHVSGKMT
jgi:ATP-binding cassette subfamily A (ABC1) protein 3